MALKKNWTLTGHALKHLLQWLDEGSDSGGQRYLAMRSRLVTYFDRKNCPNADDLADEVLDRVSRRLDEEGDIQTESPAKYCYTVARFVFMEQLRSPHNHEVEADTLSLESADVDREAVIERELQLNCLERCAGGLESTQRELITRYYIGDKSVKIANRKRIAKEMGLSLNALGIRAFRIRAKLEHCITGCIGSKGKEIKILS